MTPDSDEEPDEDVILDTHDGSSGALTCDLLFSAKLPNPLPFPTGKTREPGSSRKPAAVTAAVWDSQKKRLYLGLSNGDLCFWPLSQDGVSAMRYVGSHKGSVTCICLPKRTDGELGACGLILSGSADACIKIWDYQGKVGSQPTVCAQTLYGHAGTITGLFTYDQYILSSSTDKSVKVWKAVPGREQLVYPWYSLHATPVTLTAWVRSMSHDRSREVGDLGSFFAADDDGGVVCIVPQPVLDMEDRTQKDLVFSLHGSQGVPSLYGSGSLLEGSGAPIPHAIPVIHDRGVLVVRYVADWHLLLTLCYDQCLRCYDSDTGEVKHTWQNENRCLFLDLEIDMESKEILTVDEQGVMSVFSLKAGALLATKTVGKGRVVKIAAVLARHTYAVLSETELSVWYLNHDLDYNLLRGGHTRAVIGLYACTGGVGAQPNERDHRIFSAGMDQTVRLWDPYDMACVRVHEESHSEITAMTFYEAWNILVTGHDNGDIRLWDLDTGPWATLQQHTNTVTSLVLAIVRKNEELLISGGYDGMVVLWDIRTLRNEPPHMIAKFRAHGLEPCKALNTITHAARVATMSPLLGARPKSRQGSSNAAVAALEAAIPALTPLEQDSTASSLLGTETSSAQHSARDKDHQRRSDGSRQASVAGSATHQTLSIHADAPKKGAAKSEPVRPLDLLLAQSRAAAARRDAEEAAAAANAAAGDTDADRDAGRSVAPSSHPRPAYDRVPRSADVPSGLDGVQRDGAVLDLLALEPEVLAVQFDVAKKVIITGGNDHIIKVWSVNGYTQVGQHLGHTDAVTCLALDSNLLFSGSDDCTIRVWDTVPAVSSSATTAPALFIDPYSAQYNPVTPPPKTTPGEQSLGFTGSALKVMTGHTRCVTGLALAPRGGHLLSCSLDGTLRLWDYVQGVTVAKFTHHEEMRCLALRTDKEEVLVGTNQASILTYSINQIAPVEVDVQPDSYGMRPLSTRFPTLKLLRSEGGSAALGGLTHRSVPDRLASFTSVPGVRTPTLPLVPQSRDGKDDTSSSLGRPHSDSLTPTSARSGAKQEQSPFVPASNIERPQSRMSAAEVASLNDFGDSNPPSARGRVFPGASTSLAAGDGKTDTWRWGSAKVQLLTKTGSKLSAAEHLAALDRTAPGQLKPGSRSSVRSNQMTRL